MSLKNIEYILTFEFFRETKDAWITNVFVSTTKAAANSYNNFITLSPEFQGEIADGDLYDFSGAACQEFTASEGRKQVRCRCCNSNQNPTPAACEFLRHKIAAFRDILKINLSY